MASTRSREAIRNRFRLWLRLLLKQDSENECQHSGRNGCLGCTFPREGRRGGHTGRAIQQRNRAETGSNQHEDQRKVFEGSEKNSTPKPRQVVLAFLK